MTKFDHQRNLPELFKEQEINILPISRGNYIISFFNLYNDLNTESKIPIEYVEIPEDIKSLSPESISSEATALNYAYSSGFFFIF